MASSLVSLMKEIKRRTDPDFLFIEPSEMAVTKELRDLASQGRRDIQYDVGPVITLLDGVLFGFHWQERRPLLMGQMAQADLVAVSRADLVKSDELDEVCAMVRSYAENLFLLSSPKNLGMAKIMQSIDDISR